MSRFRRAMELSGIAFCLAVASQLIAATTISPSDTNILYTGRFDQSNPSQPVFGWSGTSIIANFQGTSLTARFDDLDSQGDNYLYYIIDDGDPVALNLNSSATDYLLAIGLSNGQHRVEIGKKTEGTEGEVKFLNFKLDDGKSLAAPPARPPRRLVFYGDSNQAGYSAECICDSGPSQYEDSYFTYPGITSRMLNAEYQNISAGGITISNSPWNWDIKDIWNKTYYGGGSGPTWNFSGEAPDAVVINLGANDLYAGQSKSQIKNGWKNFISNELRGVYPNTHIVLANSYGWDSNEPANYVHEAVEELNNAGDANVSFVRFPWLWSQAHAVTFEHAGFANILAEHLATQLGLPQPTPNELSSFAPPGQVPNGSFEKSDLPGVPDGWRFTGGGATYVEDASDAHTGTDFVRVSGGSSFFWHATDAIPGHQYELTGWMRQSGSESTGKLRIQFKNQSQQVITTFEESAAAGAEWQQLSLTATAPAGAWQIAASVLTNGGGHTVEFDDLTLSDIDISTFLPGDYSGNQIVDAADYGVWRDALTAGATELLNDPTPGTVDESDFVYWRAHFGETLGSGTGSAAAVPEPSTQLMLLMGTLAILSRPSWQYHQLSGHEMASS